MKKFFPNMETAIIFVFLICIGLWGMSRCKKKKEEAAISTATEGSISPLDTLSSPAASRPRIPTQPTTTTTAATTTTQTPLPPQYQQSPVPLPATPTNAPTPTVQTNVPQPYSVVTTSPATAKTTAPPVVTSKGVPQTTTTPPSNTMLYVLINGLNIRSKPDLKSKVKGKLKINDQVYFLEEVTEETSVTKPWFKVQTKRGTVGWVHGSGVDFYKRKPTDGF
jgi:cytoskeletal protein RodZ